MKKNKKFHTWKSKWKRKKWSSYSCRSRSADKEYRKPYHRADRAKKRMAIQKLISGIDEVDVDLSFQHRHSANWDYW